MAAFVHFLKTIFIPLFFAALLYLVLAHFLLPFVRRHRSRYSQYLPVSAEMMPSTTSWRNRMADALYNLFVPSSWGRNRTAHVVDATDEELFDDEEGEGMVGFDPIDERRREALEQRRSMMGDEDRRLGRDLEEGFKDDSDDDCEDERRRSLSRERRSGSFY